MNESLERMAAAALPAVIIARAYHDAPLEAEYVASEVVALAEAVLKKIQDLRIAPQAELEEGEAK